jgi:hypothetical protein
MQLTVIPVRTSGWEIEPFADMSAAFVFFDSPVRATVIDRLSWYVLELCDGDRSEIDIVSRFIEIAGTVTRERAEVMVADRLRVLRRTGLLVGEE